MHGVIIRVLNWYGSKFIVHEMKSGTGVVVLLFQYQHCPNDNLIAYVLNLRDLLKQFSFKRRLSSWGGVHCITGSMMTSSILDFNTWNPIVDVVTQLFRSLVRVFVVSFNPVTHSTLNYFQLTPNWFETKYSHSKNRSFLG